MSRRRGRRRRLNVFTADLLWVPALLGLVWFASRTPGGSTFRSVITAFGFIFLPGYALSTLLYPGNGDAPDEGGLAGTRQVASGVSGAERVALALGLSLVLVPFYGLAFWGLGAEIDARNSLIAMAVPTIGFMLLGFVRRVRVSDEERYGTPLLGVPGRIADTAITAEERADRAAPIDTLLTVALVGVVILAFGTFAVAVVAPQDGTTYTKVALYGQGDDGDPVANYPTFQSGQSETLYLEFENQEGSDKTYTTVVVVQELDGDRVVSQAELDRFEVEVERGETQMHEHQVTTPRTGGDTRIAYLIYEGSPPENPTIGNAYRWLSLWTTGEVGPASNQVSADAAGGSDAAGDGNGGSGGSDGGSDDGGADESGNGGAEDGGDGGGEDGESGDGGGDDAAGDDTDDAGDDGGDESGEGDGTDGDGTDGDDGTGDAGDGTGGDGTDGGDGTGGDGTDGDDTGGDGTDGDGTDGTDGGDGTGGAGDGTDGDGTDGDGTGDNETGGGNETTGSIGLP